MVDRFHRLGWIRFGPDPAVETWVKHALGAARKAVRDPAMAKWHVCENTWFVGVDALDNDPAGRVAGSSPLGGDAVDFLTKDLGYWPDLHRAQVSVVYPGYPRARSGEGEAAARYRAKRDAAHVDGLKPVGPERRRKPDEFHAFILGLPLTPASADAAPMVVWEQSHRVIRDAFLSVLREHDPMDWPNVDLTEAYWAARRIVFDTCARVEISASPGEAFVVHRLALHGVAPWADRAEAGPDGRMIAYFRPDVRDRRDWLFKD